MSEISTSKATQQKNTRIFPLRRGSHARVKEDGPKEQNYVPVSLFSQLGTPKKYIFYKVYYFLSLQLTFMYKESFEKRINCEKDVKPETASFTSVRHI